jgi:putative spermidine/putrescine transport system ATP-binding protein
MSSIGAAIRILNLVKTFGEVRAVDGISLDISAGEFLTLLGPSGSGKTTTLNLIAGFEIPTSGQILIGDDDIAFKPPHKRNLGMVFQNYALFPHMTVFQNIAFPLKNRGKEREEIQETVHQVLSLVKLEGYERRFPKQLSGGQQQRISLARSLVYNPRALLMDEPLGALDRKLREHMQIEIKRIQQETGITVIYVTHDQEEALNMSDRIAVMNSGGIEQIGMPREIYERPRNRFVADFIGDANIIEGRLLGSEGAAVTVAIWDDLHVKTLNTSRQLMTPSLHIVIRPERVKILRADDKADNVFAGKVWESSYVGDLIRYVIDVDRGGNIILKEHNRGQSIQSPGQLVRIGWNAEDALVV